jgi:ketosteroid isomerase-like protein
MSPDNVELVRKLLELAERRDYVDTRELFDSDVVFTRFGEEFADLAGEWRGIAEMWEGIVHFFREWEDLQTRPERYFDLGDQVLVFVNQTGLGRASGAIVEHDGAFLFTVHGGKIVRWEAYWDRAEACRAGGLDEQAT